MSDWDWRQAVEIFLALLVTTICVGVFCYVGWWVISVVRAG